MLNLLLAVTALLGSPQAQAQASAFPPGFFFGTSIAGFQVEMGCPNRLLEACEDRGSDWYAFITSPWTLADTRLALSKDPPSSGPGFYELYRQDLARARTELGGNALRLSIEWSRLFPKATFGVDGYAQLRPLADPAALAYYHDLFATARANGFEPFVTLNHYTLPLWIHDAVGCHRDFEHCDPRGWDDPRIVGEIAKYAGFAAHEFGAQVDYWSTLNGSFATVVWAGYVSPSSARSNPPGVFHQDAAARRATRHTVEAHARMYDAVHREDVWSATPGQAPAQVGLSGSLITFDAASKDPADIAATAAMRYLVNEMFLNAVANGDYDENWDHHPVHRDDLAHRMDYLGINYYFRWPINAGSKLPLDWTGSSQAMAALSDADTSYAADGIYNIIAETAAYHLPLFITETGSTTAASPQRPSDWLRETVSATQRAIANGYDVRGYFYWSLLDNYEWNQGAKVHFGLYAVDAGKKREGRTAVQVFNGLAKGFGPGSPAAARP